MNIKHKLKSWVGLFEPIFKGEKTHDLRVLDRDYQIGDICLLEEYDPLTKTYTGRQCRVKITYITSKQHQECAFSPFGLHPATGILSIKLIDLMEKNKMKIKAKNWYRNIGGQLVFITYIMPETANNAYPVIGFLQGAPCNYREWTREGKHSPYATIPDDRDLVELIGEDFHQSIL